MGGGTLHLKVPRRGGGGEGSSSFRNLGGKWLRGRGSKNCAFWWVGGVWIFAGITHFKSDCSSGRKDKST